MGAYIQVFASWFKCKRFIYNRVIYNMTIDSTYREEGCAGLDPTPLPAWKIQT